MTPRFASFLLVAFAIALLLISGGAFATPPDNRPPDNRPPAKAARPGPVMPVYVTVKPQADAAAAASAAATLYANPVATSSSAGGSSTATGGSSTAHSAPSAASISQGNTFAFASGPSAAPLPAGTCPQGDSLAWSIGWGFFTFSESRTRTEMECLDKLLAFARETQPRAVEWRLEPTDEIHPPPAAPAPEIRKRKSRTPTKAIAARDCESEETRVAVCRIQGRR